MPLRRIDVAFGHGGMAADGATNAGPSMSINSPEQIYSPIQIRKSGPADKPGFEYPWFTASSLAQFASFHAGPTSEELDPYFARLFGGDGSYWMNNVDFHLVGNNGFTPDGDQDLNLDKLNRWTVSAVQVNAMRGPLLLSGYGFDCGDLPVPPRGATGKDMYMFDPEAPRDRTTWKTGPVALKWDDERKVWEGGPQIVCGYAMGAVTAPTSPCNPTSFRMAVFRRASAPNAWYTTNLSDCITKESIVCVNRDPSLSQEYIEGMIFVVAVRINYEWIPIWVGCPEGEGCDPALPSCMYWCGCKGDIGAGGGDDGGDGGPGDNDGDNPTGGDNPTNEGGGGGSPGTGGGPE